MRRFRKTFLLAGLGTLAATAMPAAEQPLALPTPLLGVTDAASPGSVTMTRASADRALEAGLTATAAQLYRELLARPGADRAGLTLGLVTALLEAGRAADAEEALLAVAEPRSAAWHLRAGLTAAQLKKLDVAQTELTQVRAGELSAADHAWWNFLQGMLADFAVPRDVSKANEFYTHAENEAAAATSELARARFQIADQRVRFLITPPTPAEIEATQKDYRDLRGKSSAAYEKAGNAVEMLRQVGRVEDARRFLESVLGELPTAEHEWRDKLSVLLGMVGDRTRTGTGRIALLQVLANGTLPERQRQALQLLAQASTAEPERGLLRAELDRLIAATPRHHILDGLLFYRAQIALSEAKYRDAEDNARKLLEQFPTSPLKAQALGILTASAWEQLRYRPAANFAQQTRTELAAGGAAGTAQAQAGLRVLEAEAWFRAGAAGNDPNDFRNAAAAYAAAVGEPPANVKPGDLMFMRVLAEIRAESPDAVKVLDGLAARPDFDVENRWQAEWSLARAMLLRGDARVREAYERVGRLLDSDAPARPELRARMRWLQVRLALEAGLHEKTVALVDALPATLTGLEDATLRTEIASTALLRKAEAQFALKQEAAALDTLEKVRSSYPKSDAAAQSYAIAADNFAAKDQIDQAQKRLTPLIENEAFRKTDYYPYALMQSALLAERLGQPKDLEDANKFIELLVSVTASTANEKADLIFAARLKQGEILRKMNDFPRAQHVYEELIRQPASTENRIIARLELAKCYNAQAADRVNLDHAQLLFEELAYSVEASPDVSVEAGYNLGLLLEKRGKPDDVVKVWWNRVIGDFLLSDSRPAFEPNAKRPWWLGRTLIDLGALLEKQDKVEDARRAYALVGEKKLGAPSEGMARKALERIGLPPKP